MLSFRHLPFALTLERDKVMISEEFKIVAYSTLVPSYTLSKRTDRPNVVIANESVE